MPTRWSSIVVRIIGRTSNGAIADAITKPSRITRISSEGGQAMNLLLIILIVLLVVGVPGGWRYGGPYLGGGVGLVVLILIILALSGRL
jgi:hypothetical protein